MDSETRRFIIKEIERQLNTIMAGVAGSATETSEDIEQLFPSMPTISQRPIMHPYGYSSAAMPGTISVTAKQGEHVGNRMVLGHRDKNRPARKPGEVALYDAYGHSIKMNTSSMEINSANKELFEVLIRLLTTIINARTNTIFGPQPLIPDPAGAGAGQTFLQVKADLTAMKGS